MELYMQTVAYKQLKNFLKSTYEVNLDVRKDIKKNIVEYYLKESVNNLKKAEKNVMQKIDVYFEADNLDKKIILRKLDRIAKESNLNID